MGFAFYDKEGADAKAAEAAGLKRDFHLTEACADFYVTERLEADGHPKGSERMEALEERIAGQFAIYLELAIAGELHHMPNVLFSESGTRYCGECGGDGTTYCEECYGDGNVTCVDCEGSGMVPCDDCDGEGSVPSFSHDGNGSKPSFEEDEEPEECDMCNGHGEVTCNDCDGGGACDCSRCYGDGSKDCYDCDGTGEIDRQDTRDWEDECPTHLLPFFELADSLPSRVGRNGSWEAWATFRAKSGPKAVDWARRAFDSGAWPSGYGGEAWSAVARLLHNYLTNKVSRRVFINMAWSLEHNGGCVFNKVFETVGLADVLETQAHGTYDDLAESASDDVKGSWFYFTVEAKKSRAGLTWLAQCQRSHHEGDLYFAEAMAISVSGG